MKKQNGKKVIAFLATLAIFTLLFAFVGGQVQAKAATVKLNETKKTLLIGKTYKLKVKNTTKTVKWTSSNPKIATVSSKGLVTAKRAGTTTITAKVGKKRLKCTVKVVTMQKAYENRTIRLINKERRKYGYASFDKNPLLQSAAQKRAKELAKKFSHTRPNGYKWTSAISMDYDFVRAAENIGRDFATPQQVVDAWMDKSSTKAKIISKKYKEIGVGVYLSSDGYLYWCAIFANEK